MGEPDLRVLTSIEDAPREAWDALQDASSVPFLEWGFLRALEASGSVSPATGYHAQHLTLWRDGRLVAAAPAWLKAHDEGEFLDALWEEPVQRAAELLGLRYHPKLWLGMPIMPVGTRKTLVAAGEDRPARERQLFRALAARAQEVGSVSAHVALPLESELGALREAGFTLRPWVQFHWHNRGYRTMDDFLAAMTSRRRTRVKKELAALGEQGITVRTLRGEETRGVDARTLWHFYVRTFERYATAQPFLTPRFFELLLADCRPRVELTEARREGKLIGLSYAMAGEGALFGRYWGTDEEHPFLHFNVSLYHPIAECIARGVARYEPGAGGEHKLMRGFEVTTTYSAHRVFEPRLERVMHAALEAERPLLDDLADRWRAQTGLKR